MATKDGKPPPPGKRPYDDPVSGGEFQTLLVVAAAWIGVSLAVAALIYWLRPHVPKRGMVVVVRSGDDRRVVAVARRKPLSTPDRVLAEIDPESRIIPLPRRRVATAEPGITMLVGGRLRYDITDPDTAATAGEQIAVALGDSIAAAVDEQLHDMPLARAVHSAPDIHQRLTAALTTLRVYGIAITEIELDPFTVADGQWWGVPPAAGR
jgi:hypothetical protein